MESYEEFLSTKRITSRPSGFDVEPGSISGKLFPFQRDIVSWALMRGRSAIFADCGLGKTPIQLEWARHVHERTGGNVLILAPLAVSGQTHREGEKFGIPVTVCREVEDVRPGINVTNYQRLERFKELPWSGIVLDESSILKGFDGVMRRQITDFSRSIGYRLACTATPAPNDLIEILNHAEYLDIMAGKEIIALFFKQDGNSTHAWKLKGHAREDFWRWMASWCIAIRKPSDLGHPDGDFILPPLNIEECKVETGVRFKDYLFTPDVMELDELRELRKLTLHDRVKVCADMVNASDEKWIVWCSQNNESEALTRAIRGAVEVKGSDDADQKEARLLDFSQGRIRVMVTKASIAGHGLNWQHISHMAFVGLSHSYEQFYQAIRRCWRFGQTRPVHAYIVVTDHERTIVDAIKRKERTATGMMDEIIGHMKGLSIGQSARSEMRYAEDHQSGDNWDLHLGDSVKILPAMQPESVGLSVFSPPFPGMYAYTNSMHDMGNVKSIEELIGQYSFLAPELLRVTKPGRSCCVHLTQGVAFKGTDGYIGLKDFRGRIIDCMEKAGWIYYGEVCIEKDPQLKAIRTKDAGLLFKSLASDSARMHMALADYLIQFRKPGENKEPIRAGHSDRYKNEGWITSDEWIEWASPVWYRHEKGKKHGIRESDVLNARKAKDENDEKHLCPLQLGVIERAIKLWSNPGDLILDPFAGIGSTGFEAIRLSRRFVGVELKKSYFDCAIGNLKTASPVGQMSLAMEVA